MILLVFGVALADEPSTMLEKLATSAGNVYVKSFSTPRRIGCSYGVKMEMEAVTIRPLIGASASGLQLDINEGERGRHEVAFLDADEVDSLASALKYMDAFDPTTAPFPSWEVDYRSRGEVQVGLFNRGEERLISVAVGRVVPAHCFLDSAAEFQIAISTMQALLPKAIPAK